jgi:hypothetical protein
VAGVALSAGEGDGVAGESVFTGFREEGGVTTPCMTKEGGKRWTVRMVTSGQNTALNGIWVCMEC